MKNIKLIDLWYVDGYYNKPVKTQGFKAIVKPEKYCASTNGYVFIEPKSKAFMSCKERNVIFETLQDANEEYQMQIKDHIDYVKRQIKYYTEEIEKLKL